MLKIFRLSAELIRIKVSPALGSLKHWLFLEGNNLDGVCGGGGGEGGAEGLGKRSMEQGCELLIVEV